MAGWLEGWVGRGQRKGSPLLSTGESPAYSIPPAFPGPGCSDSLTSGSSFVRGLLGGSMR